MGRLSESISVYNRLWDAVVLHAMDRRLVRNNIGERYTMLFSSIEGIVSHQSHR